MTKTTVTENVEKAVKEKASFSEVPNLKETALRESSATSKLLKGELRPEQRVAFFEKYLGGNDSTYYKTSAGTKVMIGKGTSGLGGYWLEYEETLKKGVFKHLFVYEKDGSFRELSVIDMQSLDEVEKYDSSNKWAVKRGDSFIRDIEKANPQK